MKLRPIRRLHGLCLYCGSHSRRSRAHGVCGNCKDLPELDPYYAPADQWLAAREHDPVRGRNSSGEWNFLPVRDPLVSKARQPLSEAELLTALRPERTQ